MNDENFQHGGTNIHYLEKKLGPAGNLRQPRSIVLTKGRLITGLFLWRCRQ